MLQSTCAVFITLVEQEKPS